MSKVTVFKQVLGKDVLRISVPVTRVEKLIERVDNLIEQGRIRKARNVLSPYIIEDERPVDESRANDTRPRTADQIIGEYANRGRKVVIQKLVEHGFTRPSAYYHVRKAGL